MHDRAWLGLPEEAVPAYSLLRSDFLLERVQPGECVLDLGCGDGIFAAKLLEAGAEVIGVDVSAEAVRRGHARYPELDLRVVEADGPLPFADASFDVVWAGEVLTHVVDLAAMLSEVRRVLRPEGRLLVTTAAYSQLVMLVLALSRRRFRAHFHPRSQIIRFFSAHSLRELLEDLGFADVDVRKTSATLLASAVRPALGRAR
jgi:ubiquinone/menaquinone biosynthesis C-methylase UbiE